MANPSTNWAFADPENLAVITCRDVMFNDMPILLVAHDADDGGWQFLAGGVVPTEDAMVVALHQMVERDPRLVELADLPLGWLATREDASSPWRRLVNPDAEV